MILFGLIFLHKKTCEVLVLMEQLSNAEKKVAKEGERRENINSNDMTTCLNRWFEC